MKLKENEEVCSKCRIIFKPTTKDYVIIYYEQSGFQFHSTAIYDYVCKKCREKIK